MPFVVDSSVAGGWVLPDERSETATALGRQLEEAAYHPAYHFRVQLLAEGRGTCQIGKQRRHEAPLVRLHSRHEARAAAVAEACLRRVRRGASGTVDHAIMLSLHCGPAEQPATSQRVAAPRFRLCAPRANATRIGFRSADWRLFGPPDAGLNSERPQARPIAADLRQLARHAHRGHTDHRQPPVSARRTSPAAYPSCLTSSAVRDSHSTGSVAWYGCSDGSMLSRKFW